MFKSVPSRTKWQKGEGGREPGRSSLGNERKEEQQERRAEGLGYGVKCETRRQQWRINQQQAEAPWPLRPCTASFWVNMKGENMRERESENLLFLELCNNISILEVMLYRKRTDKKNKNRGGDVERKLKEISGCKETLTSTLRSTDHVALVMARVWLTFPLPGSPLTVCSGV